MTSLHHPACDCSDCTSDTVTPSPGSNDSFATHDDLAAETKTVLAVLNREMEKVRDQLYHLNKTHTIALMTAEVYSHVGGQAPGMAANVAKLLYREVQKTLENDDTIVSGHITGEEHV